jgi:hypothetical protein
MGEVVKMSGAPVTLDEMLFDDFARRRAMLDLPYGDDDIEIPIPYTARRPTFRSPASSPRRREGVLSQRDIRPGGPRIFIAGVIAFAVECLIMALSIAVATVVILALVESSQ